MIDIHCHILPGVDDGARFLTDSLMMAQAAVRQGIHTIIATPHHNHVYNNSRYNIIEMVDYLNNHIKEQCIPLTILPGQEIVVSEDTLDQIKNGIILPLIEESNYILIELPKDTPVTEMIPILIGLQSAGFEPIISAPELNPEMMKNRELLFQFVKSGIFTQITASSILGKHGQEVQRFANYILKYNLVHFIASNAHNLKYEGFYMSNAMEYIKIHHGNKVAHTLMENSKALINGYTIIREVPVSPESDMVYLI